MNMKTIKDNYRIEINEMFKHFPRLIKLTQEFNQNGETKLVDKNLEFMKSFLEMVTKDEDI